METPFIGEIRLAAFGHVPDGWVLCNGQSLPRTQPYDKLYNLLQDTYGGTPTTFNVPNLSGRVPIQAGPSGSAYSLGKQVGVEQHTLTRDEIPAHTHQVKAAAGSGSQLPPTGAALATSSDGIEAYARPGDLVKMNPQTCSVVGEGRPHNNLQPYLVMNYMIAFAGVYPTKP